MFYSELDLKAKNKIYVDHHKDNFKYYINKLDLISMVSKPIKDVVFVGGWLTATLVDRYFHHSIIAKLSTSKQLKSQLNWDSIITQCLPIPQPNPPHPEYTYFFFKKRLLWLRLKDS